MQSKLELVASIGQDGQTNSKNITKLGQKFVKSNNF